MHFENNCVFAGEVSFFKTQVSQSGTEYASFLLITKETFKEKEITTRIPLVAFGNNASKMFQAGLADGDYICVNAKASSSYQKDKPETSGKFNFVVKNVVKIEKKNQEVDPFGVEDKEDKYSDIPF